MTTTLRPAGNLSRWKILGLVLARHAEGRPVTLRWLAREVGQALNNVKGHLVRLRRAGLVTWDEGYGGTLRPTCRVLTAEQLLGPSPAGETGTNGDHR